MPRYRKKPVVVEAEVYRAGLEDGFEWIKTEQRNRFRPEYLNRYWYYLGDERWGAPYIETMEGNHYISEGDYIITGVKGERYPCKPDIFELTYEPVEMEGEE